MSVEMVDQTEPSAAATSSDSADANTTQPQIAPQSAEVDGRDATVQYATTSGRSRRIELFQLPSERLALEIHDPPKTPGLWNAVGRFIRALVKEPGSLILGAASLGATVAIAYVGYTINKQQVDSSKVQSKAAQEQVNVRFIEEFSKRLGELVLSDDKQKRQENLTKQRLAAITLAQYGDRVLPALKASLSVDDRDIREAAAVVVVQMLADNGLRQTVLSKLQEYFDENNPALRVGVLECLTMTDAATRLTDTEFDQMRAKILQYVNPGDDYNNKAQEQRVLLWAVKFFSYWPSSTSKDFLLRVANNDSCTDEPREAAINLLADVVKNASDLNMEQRKLVCDEVTATLQQLLHRAPDRLKPNIAAAVQSLRRR